ncbi:MAG: hypothetical protein IIZ51_10570 [Lachnospiraceae bacterium]|nr:hypothetical protein [Lachnospiraceae bacterium]
MTADERLEKLLNRAGQTISDLPGRYGYTTEQERAAIEAAADFGGDDVLILHLSDVIDRMEWALENVIRERDWMIGTMRKIGFCDTCRYHGQDAPECAPDVEAVPLKPLAKWLAGYAAAPAFHLQMVCHVEPRGNVLDANAKCWERLLRRMDWEADE